ncbi:uncharacterized protein [Branchiostoma lanceolatum]|uniref:uncharacterized protein n=1 Tax=Branchiostoma lanceolatum TaxID=7740 RepID=UPI003452098B
MNDAPADVWLIVQTDGAVISAHCHCKAGLGESCSHIASVLFYIECWTRINGNLACTQVKCTWILPTYAKAVHYERVRDIDFTSAKRLKEKLDHKIDSFTPTSQDSALPSHEETEVEQDSVPPSCEKTAVAEDPPSCEKTAVAEDSVPPSHEKTEVAEESVPTAEEIKQVYAKLNKCSSKAVALSLIKPYAGQFVMRSRNIPVVSDLFQSDNLNLPYHELLRKCLEVKIDLSDEQIDTVEKDTRTQAKGPGFFRHRAGRIGASVSGTVFHSNLAQPPQSTLKSTCYPDLYKVNTKATRHGCEKEEAAIKTYEAYMKDKHVNFQIKRCGLFIHKEHPYLHATPDFLVSCDCCGEGCGEVKCPTSVPDCNYDKYVNSKSSCLEKVDGDLRLKKGNNYYYQVQQQLFVLSEKKFCDFVVCVWDQKGNAYLVCDRIKPDPEHHKRVLFKLQAFWRICILPEILGRWYTRKCDVPVKVPGSNAVCFCRGERGKDDVTCSNAECPYGQFHEACLGIGGVTLRKTWYCPHCSRLPEYQKLTGKKPKKQQEQSAVSQAALICTTVCMCNAKPCKEDRYLKCHNANCDQGKYFHLSCLDMKRMPNNAKTTWQCKQCRKKKPSTSTPNSCTKKTKPVDSPSTCNTSCDEEDVVITDETTESVDKYRSLSNLSESDYDIIIDPNGWLTGDIVHCSQVLVRQVNPGVEGLQRPSLGPARNFDVVSSECIQILHTGQGHWVCVSTIDCLPGRVKLYDSLYHDAVSKEVKEQTNDLIGGNLVSLDYVPVQQQSNGSDCGVFSIAFAVCLVYATDPSTVTFDIPRMRPHLLKCLKEGSISMFPTLEDPALFV